MTGISSWCFLNKETGPTDNFSAYSMKHWHVYTSLSYTYHCFLTRVVNMEILKWRSQSYPGKVLTHHFDKVGLFKHPFLLSPGANSCSYPRKHFLTRITHSRVTTHTVTSPHPMEQFFHRQTQFDSMHVYSLAGMIRQNIGKFPIVNLNSWFDPYLYPNF